MKTVPILLSLAASTAADVAASNDAAREATGELPNPRGRRAALEKLSPRSRALVDGVHERARSRKTGTNDAGTNDASEEDNRKLREVNKRDERKKERKERRNQKKAAVEAREGAGAAAPQGKGAEEDRELKKTKSNKGYGGGYGGGGGGGGDRFHYDDDHPAWGGGGGHYDDDDHHDDRFGYGGGGHVSDWYGGGKAGKSKAGKYYSGKAGGGYYSGKADGGYYSGKAEGGYYSGKATRAGEEWGSECPDYAHVTVTNLSFEQAFSEIFAMTSTSDVTWRRPVFKFGAQANPAFTSLAQDADASDMVSRYSGVRGVEMIKIYDNFGVDQDKRFLQGGRTAEFKVDSHGYGHRLTLAMGMPFTNDGAVVLDSARIYDGAEYWIPAVDAGVEGNIQTCWSVPADKDDFPSNAECSEDDLSDENDNSIPGENFISMHRGSHDIDDRDALEDLLLFPECKDLDLDGGNNNNNNNNNNAGTTRFAEYFREVNFDDDLLLCEPRMTPRTVAQVAGAGETRRLQNCNLRDDENFLDFINSSSEFTDDDKFVRLALMSEDFDDFCDMIEDFNKDVEDALTTTEPHLFDWRGDIAHVYIECGYGDDWHGDDYHDDRPHDDYHDDWAGGHGSH